MPDLSLVILTYNGRPFLEELFASIKKQTIQPELIVIDSESNDGTREFFFQNGIPFVPIAKSEFDHGGTRSLGLSLSKTELVAFVTQDVVLDNPDSLELLIKPLKERETAAMSFGRQLPKRDATLLSEFARLNNYPDASLTKSIKDIKRLGIKTCFISDSYSAYKKSVLHQLGDFPANLIMCEDAYVGGKAILAGYEIVYVAEARAFHSHNYTLHEEFKRYFDIGYFYSSESWLLKNFNKAESEGFAYLKNEFLFILRKGKIWLIPESIIRNVLKYTGYRLGKYALRIPNNWRSYFSMHASYWRKRQNRFPRP